jgi:hypothetical protein
MSLLFFLIIFLFFRDIYLSFQVLRFGFLRCIQIHFETFSISDFNSGFKYHTFPGLLF